MLAMSGLERARVSSWQRAIGIRPGESRIIALVAGLFACLEAGRGFGEIGVDTLVVSRFGAGSLPVPVHRARHDRPDRVARLWRGARPVRAHPAAGRADGRRRGRSCIVERLLMGTGHPATIPLAWLTVYVVGAFGVTIAWTMAGSAFDARQAKRLFPLCTGRGDRRQLHRARCCRARSRAHSGRRP